MFPVLSSPFSSPTLLFPHLIFPHINSSLSSCCVSPPLLLSLNYSLLFPLFSSHHSLPFFFSLLSFPIPSSPVSSSQLFFLACVLSCLLLPICPPPHSVSSLLLSSLSLLIPPRSTFLFMSHPLLLPSLFPCFLSSPPSSFLFLSSSCFPSSYLFPCSLASPLFTSFVFPPPLPFSLCLPLSSYFLLSPASSQFLPLLASLSYPSSLIFPISLLLLSPPVSSHFLLSPLFLLSSLSRP